MTGVFLPVFHLAGGFANSILNGNQLSLTIQAASGDLFNIGSKHRADEPTRLPPPITTQAVWFEPAGRYEIPPTGAGAE